VVFLSNNNEANNNLNLINSILPTPTTLSNFDSGMNRGIDRQDHHRQPEERSDNSQSFSANEDDNLDNDPEKNKHRQTKQAKLNIKPAVSNTLSNMPNPRDFEPGEEDEFDPSKEGNHDKVQRDTRFGKLYRDAKNDKVWYSKERSGDRAHGGAHWKKFIQRGHELVHEADVDLTGKVMTKHKSKVGSAIRTKDLIGIK
jgi:hypothetical protein